MIQKKQKSIMKKEQFRYLGKEYVTVFNENCKSIVIDNNIIYAPNERKLNKWYKEEMKMILKYNPSAGTFIKFFLSALGLYKYIFNLKQKF